jgi:hypothetical protein
MRTKNLSLYRVLSVSVALSLCLSLSPGGQEKKAATIALTSQSLRIELSSTNGNVCSFLDRGTGLNFVAEALGKCPLWQIDMLPGSEPRAVTPSMAKRFRWVYPQNGETELRLIWDQFDLPYPQPLRVEVTVALDPKQALSSWSIAIEKPGQLHVEKVRFPRIPDLAQQPDERLAVPLWMGQLTKSPRELIDGPENSVRRLEWPYPGAMSLQCVAFYRDGGPGLYLSCDDTAAFRKAFALWGDSTGRVSYELINYPENELRPQVSYHPAYHALVGTFKGDWITAAEQYRKWGTHQPWALRSRLNLGLVPDWLLETSLWVWNRGKSDGVLTPAEDIQSELKLPVSVFWHWWHGCSYDDGFPEYLPPREGTEHFKSALSVAHSSGIHAILYMNQRLWGMTTKSWVEKGAERYAVKGLDGKVRPEIYNTYTQKPCASMCIATPFWRNTYAGIAQEAVRDLGADGIYLDQACSSLLCYDPTHGHPLGGGTFWVNGFRLLSSDIRQRTQTVRNVLLAGEGAGEAWLPYLDLMLTLQVSKERYARPNDGWEVIPFFQAVYHAYGITYGNYSSLTIPPYDELWPAEYAPKEPLKLLDRKFSTQFYLEQARTFAWGNEPTIANYLPIQRQERREEISFVLKLARVREQSKKYLLYGTFLRPPSIAAAEITFPISRLSIYAGRKGKQEETGKKKPSSDDGIDDSGRDKGESSYEGTTLPIVVGAWQAKDGNVGIAVANVGVATLPLKFDAKPYGCETGDSVDLITENGKRGSGTIDTDGDVDLQIPPREAFVIELIKH